MIDQKLAWPWAAGLVLTSTDLRRHCGFPAGEDRILLDRYYVHALLQAKARVGGELFTSRAHQVSSCKSYLPESIRYKDAF